MAPNFASGFKACGVALALVLVQAHGAEQKYTPVGATRAQVIERLGEPRRKPIAAGNREILIYPTERLVLQDGIVIEVEPVVADAPRKAPPVAEAPAPTAPAATRPGATTPPADAAPTPAANQPAANPTGATPAGTRPTEPQVNTTPAPAVPAAPVPPPEPVFEIKSVRPGGAGRTAPKDSASKAAPPASATSEAAPKSTPVVITPALGPASPANTTGTPNAATPPSATAASVAANTPPLVATPPAEESAKADATPGNDAAKASAAKDAKAEAIKKAKLRALRRNARDAELYDEEPEVFTGWSYVIAFLTIGIGVGFLWWRRRQHQLAMAATSVSRTPFIAPSAGDTGARFTAEIIGRLEWKRFEELVAAYYAKTGVMAVRTKTGPKSPVHIKISWKGEARPFAYVQCLSHQAGLIEAAPLHELVTALAAEDIRRGYVVSTGKFSVNARDFAEEKHLTLLPGDIFLEKLNALPDAARTELMQEIMAGDPVTPSCPKCEAKMLRAPDDPSLWRCQSHPDQEITVRR